MISEKELTLQISTLLSDAGLPQKQLKISRCAGGKNNRTYKVETEAGVFAAKKYFSHPHDLRDRLKAEFAFLSFAERTAEGMVPKPYVHSPSQSIALYEFLEGNPLTAGEITQHEVEAAIHFFQKLNTPSARAQAQNLENASEACFSLADHFTLIQERIQRLKSILPDSEESSQARAGVEELDHYWSEIMARIEQKNREAPLPQDQRCISPSDFGFHNALKTREGRICFLDFEYAGWDDPAKMAVDFFAQLAVPVPGRFFTSFVEKTMTLFPQSEQLIQRAQSLRSAYVVKWCCIALNVFLPYRLAQRQFVEGELDVIALQRDQLAKFHRMMQQLKSGYDL